jgi:DNA-binding transcriptional LysR family regulator
MMLSINFFHAHFMDIDLLKTFLEVNRTRHFGRAGENLFITQSAVSARIRQLEEMLGVRLFHRERNDIRLTAAGERMVKHAQSILGAWRRAVQDTAMDESHKLSLSVGGMYSLWDILAQGWVHQLHAQRPDIALSIEAQSHEVLLRKLLDGVLDVAIMFEPAHMTKLLVKELATIRLVMVASKDGLSPEQALGFQYLMVDWGASFAVSHARLFHDMPPPSVHVNLGRIARDFMLEQGGAGYLAEPMVAESIRQGVLFPVKDAPVIERSAYAVYPSEGERTALVEEALALFEMNN